MAHYVDKDALVAEIKRLLDKYISVHTFNFGATQDLNHLLSFIDTLEVKDPYEQVIQYPNIEDGIKAHAEDYSFNIESELFNQLTKEQQALWRKEIEQAVISGGYSGLNLARDTRYKETLEVKEVGFNDAFIEKALKFIKTNVDRIVNNQHGVCMGYMDGEFKNYMKG